jgi:anthranilate phosphoribosyltransferase
MTSEHPFAPYIRILGKGPTLSRPLTFDETKTAARMILDGAVEPIQLGAFLCLLRVKTETPQELAGFVSAVRETILPTPDMPAVDLDWSSYAGKSRQLPLFLLAALLLAKNGVTVFMHGTEGHTAGRLYTRETLESLGFPTSTSMAAVAEQLRERRFAYMPLAYLSPPLHAIMGLKPLLGLRSPIHTIARMLNPLRANASLLSVFHPNYRNVHQEAGHLLGDGNMAVFKGEGGEAERRPEKPCVVQSVIGGNQSEEEWPPILSESARPSDLGMEPATLKAIWTGEMKDDYAETTIIGTAAIALKLLGRASGHAEALEMARALWAARSKDRLAA